MTYKGHASARGNDAPFSSFEEQFDRTPDISASERTTLTLLHQTFETSSKVWPPGASKQIERLATPLRVTLDWLCTPQSTQFTIVHALLREMHRPGHAVCGWASDDSLESMCADITSRSNGLMRMGIIECAIDCQPTPGRMPPLRYRASDGVRPEWLDYCQRWRATSTSAPSTREHVYYRILKCGRWLADKHPKLAGPADISRAVAFEYVTAVYRMTIAEWAHTNDN